MTDSEYRRVKRHCEPLFKAWCDRLWLSHWDLHYHYLRDGFAQDERAAAGAAMDCAASWKYLHARIRIDCPTILALLIDAARADEVEECIVHEYMHCLLHELEPTRIPSGYKDHEERVASLLQRAFSKMARKK